MPAQRTNQAGFRYLQFFTVNNNGIATGDAGASPANDTTSHARRVNGGTAFGFNPREDVVVPFRNADTQSGQMSFSGGGLDPFDIETDEFDAVVAALVEGTLVDTTTNSSFVFTGPNSGRSTLPDMGLILTQVAQSRDTGTDGATQYINYIIPRCTIRYVDGGAAFQERSSGSFRVTPTKSGKFPNGVAFGANQGFEDNRTEYVRAVTDFPIALTTFVGSGSGSTFTAGYRPISTVITAGATPNWFARNGTAEALTSIVTTTGVATMAAAGDAGAMNVLIYQTNFQAI